MRLPYNCFVVCCHKFSDKTRIGVTRFSQLVIQMADDQFLITKIDERIQQRD